MDLSSSKRVRSLSIQSFLSRRYSSRSIDTIPATSRQRTQRGTYKVKSGHLVLTDESGTVHRLYIDSGQLKSKDLTFQELVFSRVIGR